MSQSKSILAVTVLYKMRAQESPAFTEMDKSLRNTPRLGEAIDWMICDNSPAWQEQPAGFTGKYVHDTTNPGLASQYNLALKIAIEHGASWLMLIDQDTKLTPAYLQEAADLASQLAADESVAAIVPKLTEGGTVLAPHYPITLRHPRPVESRSYGVLPTRIYPYNSGALLRVSALEKIGGFPQKFWLDFLDHATFHALQAQGGRIFVMHAALEHSLSSNQARPAVDPASLARQRNILNAEQAFYHDYAPASERLYYHLRMVRRGWAAAGSGAWRQCAMLLKHAVTP